VLFRGGLREAEVLLAELEAVGDGVDDILIAASSCEMSDILGSVYRVVSLREGPNRNPANALSYSAVVRIFYLGRVCRKTVGVANASSESSSGR